MILLYVWSNKCSLGKQEKLFRQNENTPNFWTMEYIFNLNYII